MENKRSHLEIIQGVIDRLSSNSFMLKGWAVTLIAAVFVLSSQDSNKGYFLIAYFPILFFWALDAFYLRTEALYRKLYEKVCRLDETDIDFSMSVDEFKCREKSLVAHMFSATEIGFYAPLAFLSAVVICIIK